MSIKKTLSLLIGLLCTNCASWIYDTVLYPATLEPAIINEYYEYSFDYQNNSNSVYFLMTDGTLPSGTSVQTTTGTLLGTPIESGMFDFCITLKEDVSTTHNYSSEDTVGTSDQFEDNATGTDEECYTLEVLEKE